MINEVRTLREHETSVRIRNAMEGVRNRRVCSFFVNTGREGLFASAARSRSYSSLNAVKQTISYLDKVSFDYLPILPTGTCIMAGLLANVPVVVDIGKIAPSKHEPKNKTITLMDKWS